MSNAANQSAPVYTVSDGTVVAQQTAQQAQGTMQFPQQQAPQQVPQQVPQQAPQQVQGAVLQQQATPAPSQPVPVSLSESYLVEMSSEDFASLQNHLGRKKKFGSIAKNLLIATSVLWLLFTALSIGGLFWAIAITY